MFTHEDPLNLSKSAFENWMSSLHSLGCHYHAEDVDPKAFEGWIRPRRIYGLEAIEINCNAPRIERTRRDVRCDGDEHFYALFQSSGRSTMLQNDQVVRLNVGDIALVDSAQPVTYLSERGTNQWLALRFPRKSLISYLGSEPIGGLHGSAGFAAARGLAGLVFDRTKSTAPSSNDPVPFMELAIYDLLGALFASPESPRNSRYSDQLFARVCDVVKRRFEDPEVGPFEIADEVGISTRYLQKLFAARGSTCTQYIQAMRLDHAARLLRSRSATKSQRPLNEIAFASGFLDYNNFGRMFRRRFGYPPSAEGSSVVSSRL